MGMCCLYKPYSSLEKVKIILHNGLLQEFSPPVKVSDVLQENPTWFICNSDDMNFDDFLSAINEDEELEPGELYFVLPFRWLKQRLQAEEMASLAVKASLALKMRGQGGRSRCCFGYCGLIQVDPVVCHSSKRDVKSSPGSACTVAVGCGGGEMVKRRRSKGGGGGGRARDFTTKLSAILEE